MAQFYPPKFTALDGNGTTIPGAKLYFYETGTSTPKDSYSDSALTTPNTNPVLADGAGRFEEIFLNGEYKVVFTDASDATIWTVDPVSEDPLATDLTALALAAANSAAAAAGYASPQVDVFNADASEAAATSSTDGTFIAGTSTTVVLSASLAHEDAAMVFFDSVFQSQDSFTLSTTTITFDAVIPAGVSKIVVSYGIRSASVPWELITGAPAVALPTEDTNTIVKGSADATKLLRFEVDGLTTATTRTVTVADQDIDMTPGTGSYATAAEGDLAATALQDITSEALSTLSDATITAIASGEILKWSGTAWINNTLAEAGIENTSHNHTGVYQPLATVLTNTTASYTTTEETKLAGLEIVGTTSITTLGTITTGTWNGTALATAYIADDAVTYAKIQNVSATNKLLGRASSGAGVIEEITCTAAGRALIDDASATAQRTTLGLGNIALANYVDSTDSNITLSAIKKLTAAQYATELGGGLENNTIYVVAG